MELAASVRTAGGALSEKPIERCLDCYGPLFKNLPAWTPPGPKGDHPGAIAAIAESLFDKQSQPPDNETIPAAYTYLAQFVSHDLTFTAGPSATNARRAVNARTPRLDLDSVYGLGPALSPHLYAQSSPAKLLFAMTPSGELDLPRNRDESLDWAGGPRGGRPRRALVGDPRNDENVILSQLHLAVLRFHNAWVDAGKTFEEARNDTRWHYQWVVVHDLLPKLCGADLVESLLASRSAFKIYPPDAQRPPFIPVEFSLGAYRAGHSMVRPTYRLNDSLAPFSILPAAGSSPAAPSLAGGRELPEKWTIQWDCFLDFEGSQYQASKKFDRKLALPLRSLPIPPEAGDPEPRSLAYRTLIRGVMSGLPSGQAVARAMAASGAIQAKDVLGDEDEPLWVYVLREAEELRAGDLLGPVAARIVAEVILGLLWQDEGSFLHQEGWQPASPTFVLAEFLRKAGAPLTELDWRQEMARADERRGRILRFTRPHVEIRGKAATSSF